MNDSEIVSLIERGRIKVDTENGLVYCPRSNTPNKPVGAKTKKGYLRLCLQVKGVQSHFMVHRIIWVSVHGPLKDDMQIDHISCNKADNRIANLEAVTLGENMRRAVAVGAFSHVGRRDGIRDSKGRFGFKKRVGKKEAGRLLDGRTWDEFPKVL